MSDPKPTVALSWLVELPHDLGLPEDSHVAILQPGDLHGWGGDDIARLPRWDEMTPDGSHPHVTLRFRRAYLNVGMPTEATDRCFGDMQLAFVNRRGQRRYRRELNRLAKQGMHEWKTVVRITKWYLATDMPGSDEIDTWLHEQFTAGLAVLNRWLGAYALASGTLFHGPVSITDLPPIVPVIMEGKDIPANDVTYGHRSLRIHDALPAFLPAQADLTAAESASRALIMDWADHPFLESLKLLFSAQVHLGSGRERHAVIDSCTAIEMFVFALLVAVGSAREDFDPAPGLKAPFRNRYEEHVPRALGDGINPAPDLGQARGAWWDRGYRLRNAVVHEGREPDRGEAADAVQRAWSLVDACGRLLRASTATEELGLLLAIARRPDN